MSGLTTLLFVQASLLTRLELNMTRNKFVTIQFQFSNIWNQLTLGAFQKGHPVINTKSFVSAVLFVIIFFIATSVSDVRVMTSTFR